MASLPPSTWLRSDVSNHCRRLHFDSGRGDLLTLTGDVNAAVWMQLDGEQAGATSNMVRRRMRREEEKAEEEREERREERGEERGESTRTFHNSYYSNMH